MSLAKGFWLALAVLNLLLLALFQYGPDAGPWSTIPGNWELAYRMFTGSWFHADSSHLLSNLLSLNLLAVGSYLIWPRQWISLFLWSWALSSVLLFMMGQPGSHHIGASTWVYAYGFFLMGQGLVYKHPQYRRIMFAAFLWYGNMWQGMLPFLVPEQMSWEGHLAGAAAGSSYLLFFRTSMKQQAKQVLGVRDMEEADDSSPNPYDLL